MGERKTVWAVHVIIFEKEIEETPTETVEHSAEPVDEEVLDEFESEEAATVLYNAVVQDTDLIKAVRVRLEEEGLR